jgi:hypothetical protein
MFKPATHVDYFNSGVLAQTVENLYLLQFRHSQGTDQEGREFSQHEVRCNQTTTSP